MKPLNTITAAATGLALTAGAASAAADMIDTSDVRVDGAEVTFPAITASNDGYVVIHEVKDGEVVAPASIGHAWIDAGENTDVTVTTDMPLDADADYVAMLHDETNGNQDYEFGADMSDVDTPTLQDGDPVTSKFSGGA